MIVKIKGDFVYESKTKNTEKGRSDMGKISYGLRGHDIADNFSDMCIKAKENGIKKLQFALAKTCNNIDFDAIGYDKNISSEISEELERNMLDTAVLGCYINPIDTVVDEKQTQLRRFENFISYAKDLKAHVIGTETGWKNTLEETHSADTYLEFLKAMEPLVKKAEDMNVQIGIEPVWYYSIYSVEVMEKMLKDISSRNISVIFDVSNLIYPGNFEAQDNIISSAFDKFGDRISTIHLKDFYMKDGIKTFAPAGLGHLNTEMLLKNICDMTEKPDIILDELPLTLYNETIERLNAML